MDRLNLSEPDLFKTLARVVYLFAGLAILIWFFFLIEQVLLISLLALILAIALNAPVNWLEEKDIPRAGGVTIVFSALLITGIIMGWLIIPRLSEEIPKLIDQIPDLMTSLVDQLVVLLGDSPEVQRQLLGIVNWAAGIFDGLWRYTDTVITAIALGLFTLALALYMLVNLRPMVKWYLKSLPPRFRDQGTRAFARASDMVIGWILATVVLGGIRGLALFPFLVFMEVPGALVWSVVSFFGAFVPRIGFYLTIIPTVLVAFGVNSYVALWTLIYYTALSEILGDFIAPRIFEQTMKLNAVFILFMTIAMGYAFGVVGVLIASPIAGFVKAYYDEFYLSSLPEVPELNERVEAIMDRNPNWNKQPGKLKRRAIIPDREKEG